MHLQKLISNYATFNEWANSKIVIWLKTLKPETLVASTPSSFTSIDLTLQHTLRTQKFWLAFITQADISNFDWSVRENETEKILAEIISNSTELKNKFSSFSEDELIEKLHLNMPWCKNNLCRYEYILHVINHSTYHRGQIITMARALGITENIPNTDYNFFNS